MIKSLNRQDVKESDYPQPGRPVPDWVSFSERGPGYICDCCMKLVSIGKNEFGADFWVATMNPRLVPVAGVIYWGCSTECARILFMIHHQYAMLEAKKS